MLMKGLLPIPPFPNYCLTPEDEDSGADDSGGPSAAGSLRNWEHVASCLTLPRLHYKCSYTAATCRITYSNNQ